MPKPYRVVPLPGCETQVRQVTVSSETDFDALEKARLFLGPDVPFKLWDGDRLALTYRGLPTTLRITRSANNDRLAFPAGNFLRIPTDRDEEILFLSPDLEDAPDGRPHGEEQHPDVRYIA